MCSYMSVAHSLVLEILLLSSWTPIMVGGVTLEVCCTDMGLYKVQVVVVDLYVDPLITWWVVNKGKGIRKLL